MSEHGRADPADLSAAALDRELVALQRQYRTASHLVAAGAVPDGCDDQTVRWWRAACTTVEERRWTIDVGPPAPTTKPAKTERRRDRLRRPPAH